MRILILFFIVNLYGCSTAIVYTNYFQEQNQNSNEITKARTTSISHASRGNNELVFCVNGKHVNNKMPISELKDRTPIIIADKSEFTGKVKLENIEGFNSDRDDYFLKNISVSTGCDEIKLGNNYLKVIRVIKVFTDNASYVMKKNDLHEDFILIDSQGSYYVKITDEKEAIKHELFFESKGESIYFDYVIGATLLPFTVVFDVITLPLQAAAFIYGAGH
ncbi:MULTISPECIES: hypothetical protein [Colwellia]|uniref:Lipoprotein n=1 Tax=Colwellia marinimaniae TaxID=1513592 RepID=A0ABQ0MYK6_9GAMM|nr:MULTISPECIES: hypothetical protein [Colwellia]GAW97435.1 hypothetical protein MTCD1_03062 [Colwellia marinimaniae]